MTIEDHLHALPPGYSIDEYRIDRVIGSGGFGITYFAWDTHLDKAVAIKEYLPNEFALRADATTVKPKSSSDQGDYQWGLERFLDEARTLARFNHPNLNRVHRFFEANGTAYLVLEYIDGQTLSQVLKEQKQLGAQQLVRMMKELLSGLTDVHKAGFVHRDIKPGNIMFQPDGSAILLDFGAARQAIGQRSKSITSILTPGYAPIEQYDQKADDVGPWTDLYALGMVAYRCISGFTDGQLIDAVARSRMQFKGDLSGDIEPATEKGKGRYPNELLQGIDWCTAIQEKDRPQTINALNAKLGFTASAPAHTENHRQETRTVQSKQAVQTQKKPVMLWGVISLLLIVVMGLAYVVVNSDLLNQTREPVQQQVESGAISDSVVNTQQQENQQEEAKQAKQASARAARKVAGKANRQNEQAANRKAKAEADQARANKQALAAELNERLSTCQLHVEANRLTSGRGGNAADCYEQVLQKNPGNGTALAGLALIAGKYQRWAETALSKRDINKAKANIDKLIRMNPENTEIEDLNQRLAELEKQISEQASVAAIKQKEVEELARKDAAEKARIAAEKQQAADRQAELERQRKMHKPYEPEMVVIPGGSFSMGGEYQTPVHTVQISGFKLGKTEITFSQWDACTTDGTCIKADDEGWGRGNRPVINVSWKDIEVYLRWLNGKTGKQYRLPSESEWEYAARAGTTTKYSWGDSIDCSKARYGYYSNECGKQKPTDVVKSFRANSWGLYDMHGNVWEWVQDCWNKNYSGAPTNGKSWDSGDCDRRVWRGGSWNFKPHQLRSAFRFRYTASLRSVSGGFRIAQDK